MEKENFCDDGSESEDEDKTMGALSDSDIDEIEYQLISTNLNHESEEYRWYIAFDEYKNTE